MKFIYFIEYHLGFLNEKKLISTYRALISDVEKLNSFAIKFKEFNKRYQLNENVGYFRYIEEFEYFLLYRTNIVIKYIDGEL